MQIKTNTGIFEYEAEKVKKDISKALEASETILDEEIVSDLEAQVRDKLTSLKFDSLDNGTVSSFIEEVLMSNQFYNVARSFIQYRFQQLLQKDIATPSMINKLFRKYIDKADWKVKENANMAYSLQGLNNYLVSEMTEKFWLDYIYPEKTKEAHSQGYIHIHDLSSLSTYCMGWDLYDLLTTGFTGVTGKVTSSPAKHFDVILGQIVNFILTLQGECYSSDTEVLTGTGWKRFYDMSESDTVATMNVKTRKIEFLLPDEKIKKFIDGDLLRFRNSKVDLLVTPKHKMLIEQYAGKPVGTGELKLIDAENFKACSNFIPKQAKWVGTYKELFTLPSYEYKIYSGITKQWTTQRKGDITIPMDIWLSFLGMYLSEGNCYSRHGNDKRRNQPRKEYTVCITQGKYAVEFREILTKFYAATGIHFNETIKKNTNIVKFCCSNVQLYTYLSQFGGSYDKYIPDDVKILSIDQLGLFYKYLELGDGLTMKNRTQEQYYTTSTRMADDVLELYVKLGYGGAIYRKSKKINSKVFYWYVVSKHRNIASRLNQKDIVRIPYVGYVYCVSTKNGTLMVRRNGKASWCGNCAGAQAINNVDTLLAPFIRYDKLSFKEVKQSIQSFVFNMNVPTRVGFQASFSNITLDLTITKQNQLYNQPVVIGGALQKETYGEFQKEMDMFNQALFEIFLSGDSAGASFSFPIPTINVTKDFDWDNKNLDTFWDLEAKYGTAYFANYVGSDLDPEDIRSMCCRLRLDKRQLRNKGGGLFGANNLVGSIGVVTLNLPMLAHESNGSMDKFYTLIDRYMKIAADGLEIKRKLLEDMADNGLYPYTKFYLRNTKARYGKYWENHFSTIGIIGMNEAAQMLDIDYTTAAGKKFAIQILSFMRRKISIFQKDTNNIFNLEATPAEGASYRLALLLKNKYPKAITSGEEKPFLTNSSMLPVNYSSDVFKVLDHQKDILPLYTGGSVLHLYTGEKMTGISAKTIIKKIITNYKIPYVSLTPIFSICEKHGYIAGEHKDCPICIEEKQVIGEKIKVIKSKMV